ncbi:MAG: T9SS type A sorting domain-containing protein, partial [Cytophagales bacterium]|nr:T9SS type A sorting domain-containing protein [Cytophagales bacterium]
NDLVTVNDNSSLNFGTGPFTFEAKIRSRRLTTGNIQVILSKRNTTQSNGFMFGLWSDGHLWCQMMGAPNLGYDQGPTLLDGQCHHVTITRSNSGVIKFYIDGQMTYQVNSGLRNISDMAGPLRIGFDKFSSLPFDGIIGEIRLWNYERTLSQIQANLTSQLMVEPGLVANYWLNGPFSSQNVTDASGYGNTGVLGISTAAESSDPAWYIGSSTCSNNQTLRGDSLSNTLNLIGKKEVVAAPNPFAESIMIATTGFKEGFSISVYDVNGNVVFENLSVQDSDRIGLGADWVSGIYFVRISDGEFTQVLKIVKIN